MLANPHFGTVVSESGSGLHLGENAHEFRLTPWHNDPVTDASGEAFYLRDEETGRFWSPTPLPGRGAAPYVTPARLRLQRVRAQRGRHRHRAVRLRRARRAGQVRRCSSCATARAGARRLSATGYVEWVLGDLRAKIAHARGHRDRSRQRRAVRAQRLQHRVRRAASRSSTCDDVDPHRHRRPHRVPRPQRHARATRRRMRARAALRARSARRSIPAPRCRSPFDLADGQEREIVFTLGVGRDADDARAPGAALPRHRGAARAALEAVWQYWNRTLGAVQVETPDPALNVLANGWLLYQTLACRLWGAQRLLPVGRRLRLPRSAAGRDGAGPCRAAAAARAPAALRGAPVPRRRRAALVASARRAAACARISRTTTSGCRWRLPLRRCAPATPACSTRRVPFLEGRAGQARGGRLLRPAARARTKPRTPLRALRARHRARACASARTACR